MTATNRIRKRLFSFLFTVVVANLLLFFFLTKEN